ncbi:MAG TPA: SulP family inorganic anion transporter [Gallionellaceae bacterium]|nr:SulP family inorganic anion transporter [Gallionellaceae bacterium]
MNIRVRHLPFARLFADFTRLVTASPATIKQDLLAGITVSLVAIPQSLAYAQLAGVPAYYGLYAALIPTIIGALFGSSRQLSTGPVAMTSLLTAASVAPFAAHGSEMFYAYVILLALLSGLFQVLFGALRMGVLLNFLSHPVLMGFINAAAIIIGLSQLPTLLGISAAQSDHFLVDIWHVFTHLDTMHGISVAFGLSAIILLLFFKKILPKLPGVLITVVLLTVISYLIGYAEMGGRVVGVVPRGVPDISLPLLDWHATVMLLPAAFVISLISFMEAMSSAKVIAIKTRQPWDENKELIGQGLAKIAAAFSHSMPVSGSFSRSALNLATNAQTGFSSVVSAIFVLLTLIFFTPLLFHLPKPVLAAVIIMAVIGLINFVALSKAWRASRDDGFAAVATFVTTLVFAPNIQNGIITGILLSLALLLYRMMQPRVAVLGRHHDGTLRDAQRHNLAPLHPKLGAIRFDGALRFVNVSYFEDALLTLERENPSVRYILVKCDGINYLDASGVEMLSSLISRFKSNGIALGFSGIKKQVQEVIDRTGLDKSIGPDNIFATDQEAFDTLHARGVINTKIELATMQQPTQLLPD